MELHLNIIGILLLLLAALHIVLPNYLNGNGSWQH